MSNHAKMVEMLFKSGKDILDGLNPNEVKQLHAALGIAGEAGEVVDVVKKFVIHRKDMPKSKLIAELGDLEFYLEALRQAFSITREQCLEHNINKLSGKNGRYKDGYSDGAANADRSGENDK